MGIARLCQLFPLGFVLLLVLSPTTIASAVAMTETADTVLVQSKERVWDRYIKRALNLPDWIELGLEHRTRFGVYDYPWRSSQSLGRTDPQIEQRSRLRVGGSRGSVRFLFEGQDSRTHLDDSNDFVNNTIVDQMDILQLLVSATAENIFDTGFRADLHLGRFTMDFGRGWLIWRNRARNTTNAFDGLHGQIGKGQDWRIRAFLVEPVIRDDVQLNEQSKRNMFWGVYGETHHVPWLFSNAYYFGLNDQQDSNVSRHRTFSTFGFRVYKNPIKKQFDYEIETIWQTGKRGLINHFAHFQHVRAGYTFDLPWSPRILLHYNYASGDRDSNDSQDSAFDMLFGARREFNAIANFGPFFLNNISSPGWRIIAVPRKGWLVQLKHRVWYLATSRGGFGNQPFVTSTNGVLLDATGGSGNFLGQDIETRVQWTINDNWNFDAGYTHWFKGTYFDRLPAAADLPTGGNIDTDYFYIETTFRI